MRRESETPAIDANAFWQNGFGVVRRVSPADEVAAMRPLYDDLFGRRAGERDNAFFDFVAADGDMLSPQMVYPSRYARMLRRSAFWRHGFAIARQLLGRRPRLFFDHAMMKPPLRGHATPWHQDAAFEPVNARGTTITIWMALQDVDRRSGCLEFVPASHRGPVLPHRRPGNDPSARGLELSEPSRLTALQRVACPLRAGDATVHHGLTLHRSYPNLSPEPRRAYALVFSDRWLPHLVHRPHPWNRTVARSADPYAAAGAAAPEPIGWRSGIGGIAHRMTLLLRSISSS